MSKLSSLVDDFEKAVTEADSKRQEYNDLNGRLSTAKTQLESAELKVKKSKSDLDEELNRSTATLTDQSSVVKFV